MQGSKICLKGIICQSVNVVLFGFFALFLFAAYQLSCMFSFSLLFNFDSFIKKISKRVYILQLYAAFIYFSFVDGVFFDGNYYY